MTTVAESLNCQYKMLSWFCVSEIIYSLQIRHLRPNLDELDTHFDREDAYSIFTTNFKCKASSVYPKCFTWPVSSYLHKRMVAYILYRTPTQVEISKFYSSNTYIIYNCYTMLMFNSVVFNRRRVKSDSQRSD